MTVHKKSVKCVWEGGGGRRTERERERERGDRCSEWVGEVERQQTVAENGKGQKRRERERERVRKRGWGRDKN